MLKKKGYWISIQEKDFSLEIKMNATNLIESAFGDVIFSVCMDQWQTM